MSVPVAAVMEGEATIAGRTEHIKIEMDYGHFREVGVEQVITLIHIFKYSSRSTFQMASIFLKMIFGVTTER